MAEGEALGAKDLFEKDAFQNAYVGAKELLEVIKETKDTIKGSIAAQKEFVSTFKAKSFDDVKKLNQAIAETNTLIKQKEQLSKAEIAIQQQSEKLAQEKLKTQREEIKNTQLIEKQNKATERSLNALNGEYAKGVKQLAEIKKQLKELEYTGRNNGKVYKALSQEFETLNKSVRGAEEKVGEFQRNVGNYASGFNPLSNSINQLTREMPAFANSVQTGFMAISNNIPAFFDAISGIKKANAELRAQGEPTKSVLNQLGAAMFSWGTALSVGVTLLTVYGKELVNFVAQLFKGKNALIAVNEVLATTYEESTKIIREYTDATLDLLEAQGKITKVERQNIGVENELQRERNKRFQAYLTERKSLAEKLGIELDANGNPITTQEKTGVLGQGREGQDAIILAQQARNRKRLEDAKIFNNAVKSIEKVYQEDIERLESTAAKKKLINQLSDSKKATKQTKEINQKDLKERKKEFDNYWNQYQKDLETINKDIEEADIQMLANKRDRELAENEREYARRKKVLEDTKIESEQKNEALLKLLDEYNQKRIDIYKKYEDKEADEDAKLYKKKHDLFLKIWKQYEKDSKDAADKDKKQMQDTLKEMDKIEKALEQRYANKNKVVNEYLNQETTANEKAIEAQEKLAEKGLQNTLAFEKQKSAQLELERKRQQEREIKQQKVFAFYNLFSSYAKTDPNTALQKAIVDTAIAEVVSGSFIEGTESVERDLKGNKVHNGQDGYVVAVDGGERILNPKQNALIGNISNDELVGIVNDFKSGTYSQKMQVLSANVDMSETNNLLRKLLDKPISQTHLDNLGNVIQTKIRNGVAEVTKHQRRI